LPGGNDRRSPDVGSFGAYAEHYIGPWAGFLVRYAYWYCVVLAVGTEMADTDYWRERLPLNGELLRLDIDPRKFNDFYPCAVALHGDARATLDALLQALPHPAAEAGAAIQAVADLRQAVQNGQGPLQQIHRSILQRIAAELPEHGFIASDMTQLAYSGNYLYPSRATRSWLHPTGYGTLGYGLPAGIGAKLGAPSAQGWCWWATVVFSTPCRNWPRRWRSWTARWWCCCGTTTPWGRSATTCST